MGTVRNSRAKKSAPPTRPVSRARSSTASMARERAPCAGGGRGVRPERSAAATARVWRWVPAKVYPVAGRVAPPAAPIGNTEAPVRRGSRASVIGITPCSVPVTV